MGLGSSNSTGSAIRPHFGSSVAGPAFEMGPGNTLNAGYLPLFQSNLYLGQEIVNVVSQFIPKGYFVWSKEHPGKCCGRVLRTAGYKELHLHSLTMGDIGECFHHLSEELDEHVKGPSGRGH